MGVCNHGDEHHAYMELVITPSVDHRVCMRAAMLVKLFCTRHTSITCGLASSWTATERQNKFPETASPGPVVADRHCDILSPRDRKPFLVRGPGNPSHGGEGSGGRSSTGGLRGGSPPRKCGVWGAEPSRIKRRSGGGGQPPQGKGGVRVTHVPAPGVKKWSPGSCRPRPEPTPDSICIGNAARGLG